MGIYRWRLTFNVPNPEYVAFMELSRKARTSPSALGLCAIRKLLADAENATPLIPAAATMPETEPNLSPAGSFVCPLPETGD